MIRPTLLAILSLTSAVALAQNPAPHQHGVARLNVAIDRDTLLLEFSSPLDSLVGFEHAPRSAKEKAALDALTKHLGEGGKLFALSPEAACTQVSVEIHSPLREPSKADKPTAKKPDHNHHDGHDHADLDVEYLFRCRTPSALGGLEVRLFEAFPQLHRIDAQVAAPHVRRSVQLVPTQRKLAWYE